MSETIEYRGREIEIWNDECPLNPRVDYDNIGTMVYKHRNYTLGDEEIEDPIDFLNTLLVNPIAEDDIEYSNAFMESIQALVEVEANYIILPVYIYEHGGITISTGSFSCQWDSGQCGYIYAHKDKVNEFGQSWIDEYHDGDPIKALTAVLKGEVETFAQYLEGAVYGFTTGDDSCGGFFGYDHEASGLLDEAKSNIDHEIKAEMEERIQQVKNWIKNKVPLGYRVLPKLI